MTWFQKESEMHSSTRGMPSKRETAAHLKIKDRAARGQRRVCACGADIERVVALSEILERAAIGRDGNVARARLDVERVRCAVVVAVAFHVEAAVTEVVEVTVERHLRARHEREY